MKNTNNYQNWLKNFKAFLIEQKVKKILRQEFNDIKSKFADDRKTRISGDFEEKKLDELIPKGSSSCCY